MRKGFTLLEVVFVIVILGVMSKFGVELLYKIYESYVYSNTFNRLQNSSEMAVKQIANRLQYRIKDSTIARDAGLNIVEIGSITGSEDTIEWMGVDLDGWRNAPAPLWSGFIDLAASTNAILSSPGSTNPGNGALFFIGSDVDLGANFGWNGVATQAQDMHPVTINAGTIVSSNATPTFVGVDVFEFYQFSRSAYQIDLENDGTLVLYSGYQPWAGQGRANRQVLMENVTTFQFGSVGDILFVKVCVGDNGVTGLGEYSVCKEKVVF